MDERDYKAMNEELNPQSCQTDVSGSTSLLNWIPTNSEQCNLHKPETCFVVDKKGNVSIDNYHNGIENWFKSEYSHYIIITYPDAP
jgi:hypothetical protein